MASFGSQLHIWLFCLVLLAGYTLAIKCNVDYCELNKCTDAQKKAGTKDTAADYKACAVSVTKSAGGNAALKRYGVNTTCTEEKEACRVNLETAKPLMYYFDCSDKEHGNNYDASKVDEKKEVNCKNEALTMKCYFDVCEWKDCSKEQKKGGVAKDPAYYKSCAVMVAKVKGEQAEDSKIGLMRSGVKSFDCKQALDQCKKDESEGKRIYSYVGCNDKVDYSNGKDLSKVDVKKEVSCDDMDINKPSMGNMISSHWQAIVAGICFSLLVYVKT